MPTVAVFAALTALPEAAQADTLRVQTLRQGTTHDALYALDLDGDFGVSVGNDGQILETRDGGETWSAGTAPPTPLALLGVSVRQPTAIAVGQLGTVLLRTADGRWSASDSGTRERLLRVVHGPNQHAVIVGAFGTVLLSRDGGQSWASIAPDWFALRDDGAQPHLYAVHIDADGQITLSGEFGLILRSSDWGQSWATLRSGTASLFDLQLLPNGTGYAVGQNSTVLRSRDGGQHWSRVHGPGKVLWLSVQATATGQVLVSGMREALSSTDGERQWQRHTVPPLGDAWMAASHPAPPPVGGVLAVGQAGRILRLHLDATGP